MLQLLNELKSGLLVITHVLVPGIRKLLVLYTLCVLDVYQFALLGNAHIVTLALLFILAPPLKDLAEVIGHHVVVS